jgi:arabinoxylan arabinofuranohydrolase
MKGQTKQLIPAAVAALGVFCAASAALADNPIITHQFLADPNAVVIDDRVYIYCSHDLDEQDDYNMVDYILISSDDLVNWTDHGVVFDVTEDTQWAHRAYAPAAVKRDDKYYLYFPNSGNNIGVAVADNPEGPFVDPLGGPLVSRSTPNADVEWCFDPAVFVDDDGQAYLYFGGGDDDNDNARVILLNDDMISVDGPAITIDAPRYFEAPFMHKYEGQYYFSYSTDFSDGAAKIDYMTSDSPIENFVYQGTVLRNPPSNRSNNNHASIFELGGNWYVAYHNRAVSNAIYQRSVNVDQMFYNEDGTIQSVEITVEGVEQLAFGDPYSRMEAETFDNQQGIETEPLSDGGRVVGSIEEGDWVRYTGFDFDAGAVRCNLNVASSGKATIALRLDSADGKVVGTCDIPNTGGLDTYETVGCPVSGLKGVSTVYAVFDGSGDNLLNLDWLRFFDTEKNAEKDDAGADDGCSCRAVGNHRRSSVGGLLRWLFE